MPCQNKPAHRRRISHQIDLFAEKPQTPGRGLFSRRTVRSIGGGHAAHHIEVRHNQGQSEARPRRGPAQRDVGLHERQI
jgi:hypothetical protein